MGEHGLETVLDDRVERGRGGPAWTDVPPGGVLQPPLPGPGRLTRRRARLGSNWTRVKRGEEPDAEEEIQ
jgi:hypothetical protein